MTTLVTTTRQTGQRAGGVAWYRGVRAAIAVAPETWLYAHVKQKAWVQRSSSLFAADSEVMKRASLLLSKQTSHSLFFHVMMAKSRSPVSFGLEKRHLCMTTLMSSCSSGNSLSSLAIAAYCNVLRRAASSRRVAFEARFAALRSSRKLSSMSWYTVRALLAGSIIISQVLQVSGTGYTNFNVH